MMSTMRTTLTLDDDLAGLLKQRAPDRSVPPMPFASASQCAAGAGPFGAATLRMRGTSSVATTKASMMARKASAKASVEASR